MKMMIIGDIHFGVRNNSVPYLDFQTEWFLNELIPLINKEKIDHVVFEGDMFDSRNSLSPLVISRVREIFKELTKHAKIHCILGNHDLYFRNNKSIHSLCILEDQGVKIYENPTTVTISNKEILMLPWIVKDEQQDIANLLVNNKFDFCIGHLEINDFEMVPGVKEENGLRRSLFSSCGKVFSGHFHLRRKIGNIQYTGTPYELSWNDHGDEKGVYIVDLSNNDETFIQTKLTPRHLKISNDTTTLKDINKELVTNNILRVLFKGDITEVQKINFIEKVNSLSPMSLTVDDETDESLETDENIEASIKDTMGFLNEYLELLEIPDELDHKLLRELLNEVHDECV
jgi:DNA repair exonuclease SbcCD nuclease subunit